MATAEAHAADRLLTVEQVAARLQVSKPTIYRLISNGQLPDYAVFRSPTPHPLAELVGLALAPFGLAADRIWVLLTLPHFCFAFCGAGRVWGLDARLAPVLERSGRSGAGWARALSLAT